VLLTATTYKADYTVESRLNGWGSIILKSQRQTKFEDFWRGLMAPPHPDELAKLAEEPSVSRET
jgi:hypothetical protein